MTRHSLRLAAGAVAAASLAVAAPAFASTPWVGVPLHSAAGRSFVADGVFWRCNHKACRTGTDLALGDELGACNALVRRVGPLRAFSAGGPAYDAKHLAACNAVASKS